MTFQTLASLTAISKPAQEQVVAEGKSNASDFDGIRSIVEDSLADLQEKVEALMDLAKSTGAIKLDTVKDKDGHTVFKKIQKLAAEAQQIKKLMTEAEAMIMQVAEGQVEEGEALLEGKDYSDSAEFTDEFYGMISKVNDIKRIVKAPRFMSWMKVTDHNFDTNCEQLGRAVIDATDALHTAVNELEDNLDSAS